MCKMREIAQTRLGQGVQRVNMTTSTISDDGLRKLREKASGYQVAPEDLVRVSLEDLLDRLTEDFPQALEYVLNKNRDLYQRLA